MKNGEWKLGLRIRMTAVLVAAVAAWATGCRDEVTPPPTEFIVWGDPQSDETSSAISDVNNRGFRVSTDGRIQDASLHFCEADACNVNTNGDVSIGGETVAEIRWATTTGEDDIPFTADDRRRPFFVSMDGLTISIEQNDGGFVFSPSTEEFDPEGVAGNDKAFFFGVRSADASNPES